LVAVFGLGSPNLGRKRNNVREWVEVRNRIGASSGQVGESDGARTVSGEVEERNG
jgi:hypothetical protein